ncbi:hypothetical protein BH11PSE13_BH11PSE13_12270 [soil metagenome]
MPQRFTSLGPFFSEPDLIVTKQIRIENADQSTWKAQLRVQQKINGEWIDSAEPPKPLHSPCSMQTEYLTDSRRIVIEELPPAPTA